jgi:hypothetical protein
MIMKDGANRITIMTYLTGKEVLGPGQYLKENSGRLKTYFGVSLRLAL